MFCENCGTKLSDTAKFCKSCGARVDGAAPAYPREDHAQAAYRQPDAVYTRTASEARARTTSQRRTEGFSVSARPEVRVMGKPVRGRGAWIAIGIFAVVVIALIAWSKLGGNTGKPAAEEPAGRSFTAAAESTPRSFAQAAAESTPEPAPKATPEPKTTPEPAPEATPEPAPEAASEPAAGTAPGRSGFTAPAARSGGGSQAYDYRDFSTYEMPTPADFQWLSGDILHGWRPEGRESLTDFDEVLGGWKCYLIDDPNGQFDSSLERLMVAYITGTPEEAVVTFDWFYTYDNALGEGFDDSSPDTDFTGSWTEGEIRAIGPGSVSLTDFWYLDGQERAVGMFMWPDGMPALIALARP